MRPVSAKKKAKPESGGFALQSDNPKFGKEDEDQYLELLRQRAQQQPLHHRGSVDLTFNTTTTTTTTMESAPTASPKNSEKKERRESIGGGFGIRSKPSGLQQMLEEIAVQADSPASLPRKGFSFDKLTKPTKLTKLMDEVVPAAIEKMDLEKAQEQLDVHGSEGDEIDMKHCTIKEALKHHDVNQKDGLSLEEVEKRMVFYGPNALPEVKVNHCLKFLSFMWNPLSWVMESAAIVAIALSNGPTPWLCDPLGAPCNTQNQPPDWQDFVGIVCLLILNSIIGYMEEEQAGKAVDALMNQLSRSYMVLREGKWVQVESAGLVPGDIMTIKLGDIIPADAKLLMGEPLKVDQAALTGESLPVTKQPGDTVFAGSTVKQGEIEVLVYATGANTFNGKASVLVASTQQQGHLQKVLTSIGFFCVAYILVWVIIICGVGYGEYDWDYRRGIDMVLVVLIGGIPIAMPTVLSVTMAIGVNELAKEQAVVTRITAVEELAGMDVLCSDKTGTLTLNHLTVDEPYIMRGFSKEQIMLCAALSARRFGDPDAIDRCICEQFSEQEAQQLNRDYLVTKFQPFDPVSKRTEATVVELATKRTFMCSKGAPQIIINMAHNAEQIREEQVNIIAEYAQRGLRAIAVARSDDEGVTWKYMGLISLSDPPRNDTASTVKAATALGIRVVMITGDQVAIGRETARRLNMGLNFHAAKVLQSEFIDGIPISRVVEEASGWGEVMPEDKYKVVKMLKDNGHIVGMTGDGVNDAPALKVADVGIAVADATDAARSAADMVLLTEGLSVIIKAILGSRCIFQRMRNYAIYACTTTIRIVTSFALLSVMFEFTFPPFLILIIAILNDGTIMTIATDRVKPSTKPDQWNLKDIFIHSFVLGYYMTVSTVFYYYLVANTNFFDQFGVEMLRYAAKNPIDSASQKLTGVIYLQVSITGQLIIFSTRARGFFFLSRPSTFLMVAFCIAQACATLIAVYAHWEFAQLEGIGWGWAVVTWVWSLVWYAFLDLPKMMTQSLLDGTVGFTSGFESKYGSNLRKFGLGMQKKQYQPPRSSAKRRREED